MALVPNRPAAMVRRVATWSLVLDIVVAGIIYLAISHILGFIIFLIGLFVTGVLWYNFNQMMKTRGLRR